MSPATTFGSRPDALKIRAPWAVQPPLPTQGVVRVRPMPFEAPVSYIQRLADIYRLGPAQLLDGLGIDHSGTAGTAPATELHLNAPALQHVAAWAGIGPAHLDHALGHGEKAPSHHWPQHTGHAPKAQWRPTDPALRAVHACTCCIRSHSHGTTATAWAYLPEHQRLCPRHLQASSDHRLAGPLNIHGLPELTRAHQQHQRLRRRQDAPNAYTWATSITTRWYDHQRHLAPRWTRRLEQLAAANEGLLQGNKNASEMLLTRSLITYPETITLARALARVPARGLPHTQHARFLQHLAHALGLPRLAPPPSDLLSIRLTPR
ncbi:hypothetical protein [Streptomyces sp. NPDC057280]|uniref:hypothetical protein n=1 Tax=Streptomyces sp. NPDC057280 TaxID=3346081 RepID=UPI00362BE4D1